MSDTPLTLSYGRSPRSKRTAWLLAIGLLAVVLSVCVYYREPLARRAIDAYRLWQVKRAEQRAIAAMPKPGDVVFANLWSLLPAGQGSRFEDRTAASKQTVTHYFRPWVRTNAEWAAFYRANQLLPSTHFRVGSAFVPTNFIRLPENATVLSLQRVTVPDGTEWNRAVVLDDANAAGSTLSVVFYRPPGSALPSAPSPTELYRAPIRWQIAEGPVTVKVAKSTRAGAIFALDVEQAGNTYRAEIREAPTGFDLLLARNTSGDNSSFGRLPDLRRSKPPVTALFAPVLTEFKDEDSQQLFFCAARQSLLAVSASGERRVLTEISVGGPLSLRTTSVAVDNSYGHTADYDPQTDELLWQAGPREAKGLWVAPSSDIALATQTPVRLPAFDPVARFDRAGGRFVVTGYRHPLTSVSADGLPRWTNPTESHRDIVAGKSVVITEHYAANDYVMLVCDAKTGQRIRELPVGRGTGAMALSPDESLVAFGDSLNPWLGVMDVATAEIVAAPPVGSDVDSVCFSPDGRWVAFAGRELMLIDLADRKQPKYYTFADPNDRDMARKVAAATFDPTSKNVYFLTCPGLTQLRTIGLAKLP